MAERFPIVIYTFERTAENFVFDAEISDRTMRLLHEIYRRTNDRCQNEYDNSRLENSLFGCFLDEGFFIYSFFDINSREISMRGLFIPNEYKRTAWRIYLRNIMCIAASDEFRNTTKTRYSGDCQWLFSISEIAERRLNVEYYLKINQYFIDMDKSVPHNFAMTDYPIRKLPLIFTVESKNYDNPEENADDGQIVINSSVVNDAMQRLCEDEGFFRNIYILRTSKKAFIEMKKDELREKGMKKSDIKDEAEDIESEFKKILSDYVWYILNNSPAEKFTYCLDPETIKALENGCIDFAVLNTAVKNAYTCARRKMDLHNDYEQSADRKKGFFGQLPIFRKK